MDFTVNPPDAAALMTSARSFGNYDLPAALSDLIDNSIKARARIVELTCLFNGGDPFVSVLDDGHGMTAEELCAAMRPASTNPDAERSADDLGRFGWGLKAASFSQCRELTVISSRSGTLSGACWNLKDIDQWRMGILSAEEIASKASASLYSGNGTEVIWTDCDRLSDRCSLSEDQFNALVAHAKGRIALTFHKYLEGKVAGRKLSIRLNGQALIGTDPFYRDHDATQQLEDEDLTIGGARILIQPFILPHYSKLGLADYDRLGGEEGYIRTQGFYVYRNHRLIINGTWFRLVKHGEISQLIRVSIDIPNTLDSQWRITLDKSNAQLPTVLRARLKQIVDRLKGRFSSIFRSRGGRLDIPSSIPVWSRYARNGEITYSINREHPVISALMAGADDARKDAMDATLKLIEQGFPVMSFGGDSRNGQAIIHQTESDPRGFLDQLDAALPMMLLAEDGNMDALLRTLKSAEPFSLNWSLAQDHLIKKGWIDE